MQLNFLSPRKPFLGLAVAAMAGIVLGDRWVLPLRPLLVGAGVVGLVLLWRPSTWLCRLFAGLAFFILHSVNHHHGFTSTFSAVLAEGPYPAEATGVVWSEPDAYAGFRGEERAKFTLMVRSVRLQGPEYRDCGMCVVRWSGPAPAYGDVVTVRGTARMLKAVANPGEFDTADWLRRRGISFEIVTREKSDCTVTGGGEGSRLMRFASAAQTWIKARLETGLDGERAVTTLIESMVLGLRGDTPPEMKGLFQKTGTLHLFAVSGLNVAMLGGIAWYLLKPLRFSRASAFFVIMPLLAAYAVVTGSGASCVRATVMAGFVLASPLFGRPAVPLNSLAAAAVVILAWDTNELFTPGFQLSFVLVIFIMGFTTPIARRLEPMARPDDFLPEELWSHGQRAGVAVWRQISQAMGVTVSAWLGSFAFMAGYFHLIYPVAIVANAVAVPLAFCVLALGLMSLVMGTISAWLCAVVNHANWLAAKLLVSSLALFSAVPGGHYYVEIPRLERAPDCELTVLDAGEGAAIHIRGGGGDWLLDCGGERDYGNTLLPYLRSRGVNRLDGMILSHGDSTHIGSWRSVMDDFRPRWIADTMFKGNSPARREIHATLAARNFGRRYLERGDEVLVERGPVVTILYPPRGLVRSVADDRAMVCRIEAAGLRVLCVSDAGFFTEQWLTENEPDLRADVLVKGWHSRDFSGTADFLARVRPKAVVTSEMPFGSVRDREAKWEKTVLDNGATLFRQDRCGAVRIEMRAGGGLVVRSFLGGQAVAWK